MIVKTIFSGFGGQGVLMMGYTYASAAMNEGYHVTYIPSYGAEMRGGTANCTVAVSDEEIASPIASEPDCLVVMNKPALYTFQNRLASQGIIFMNSSMIDVRPTRTDIAVCEIPIAQIAADLGNPKVQNVVMMGAFLRKTGVLPPEAYLQGLKDVLGKKKPGVMEVNRKAFMAGYEYSDNKGGA